MRDRPICYWGINCNTMDHKKDHAKKYNHCIYQTRFSWYLPSHNTSFLLFWVHINVCIFHTENPDCQAFNQHTKTTIMTPSSISSIYSTMASSQESSRFNPSSMHRKHPHHNHTKRIETLSCLIFKETSSLPSKTDYSHPIIWSRNRSLQWGRTCLSAREWPIQGQNSAGRAKSQ